MHFRILFELRTVVATVISFNLNRFNRVVRLTIGGEFMEELILVLMLVALVRALEKLLRF